MPHLPPQGPIERYAQVRAALADKKAFLDAFPGVAAFVRLDERGGDDEPAPWAFHGSGLPLPVDIPSTDEDVFLDRTKEALHVPVDESTLTGPMMRLSIPAARGRATLHVVPNAREVLVGRDRKCDVVINERSISKQHCMLIYEGGKFTLVDLGSHNGIAVNSIQAQAKGRLPLKTGDIVDLGDVALLFLDGSELWDGLPRLQDG